MSVWVCPHDRRPLTAGAGGPRCAGCNRTYETPDGIPIFASAGAAQDRARRPVAELERLQGLLAGGALEASAEGASWTLLLSVPREGRVLEIGPGLGDDTLRLVRSGARPVLLVPHLAAARIVELRLVRDLGASLPIAVTPALEQLPLADGSIDAIAMDDAAAAGFGVVARELGPIVAEWQRVLAPGGSVVLGWPNAGVRRIHAALSGRKPQAEPIQRRVKQLSAEHEGARYGPGPLLRAMERHGFGRPAIHAPLPDERRAQALVPLADAGVTRYFLRELIRRNSPLVRLALRAAELSLAAGLLRHAVPYGYLLFRRDAAT